jgi:hypothetical protein
MQKKCMLNFFVVQSFFKKQKKKSDFRLGQLGLLKEDADIKVMIALRGEMEPEFLKNAKKQGMLNFFVVQFFFQKIKKNQILDWANWAF